MELDNLLNKRVKVTFQDGDTTKAIRGLLTSVNDNLILIYSEYNTNVFISIKNIHSLKELLEGE